MINKHTAMIDYLCTCPTIRDNPLFFNFGEAKENNTQFITASNAEKFGTEYIDGTRTKYYVFTLLTFKTISYNAIVKTPEYKDENLLELTEFQEVIDWINDQEDLHNYPDFGTDCVVESIVCGSANPQIEEVRSDVEPAIAIYSITIQVEYLDKSKQVWK